MVADPLNWWYHFHYTSLHKPTQKFIHVDLVVIQKCLSSVIDGPG